MWCRARLVLKERRRERGKSDRKGRDLEVGLLTFDGDLSYFGCCPKVVSWKVSQHTYSRSTFILFLTGRFHALFPSRGNFPTCLIVWGVL